MALIDEDGVVSSKVRSRIYQLLATHQDRKPEGEYWVHTDSEAIGVFHRPDMNGTVYTV
jgi:hypothetical protein